MGSTRCLKEPWTCTYEAVLGYYGRVPVPEGQPGDQVSPAANMVFLFWDHIRTGCQNGGDILIWGASDSIAIGRLQGSRLSLLTLGLEPHGPGSSSCPSMFPPQCLLKSTLPKRGVVEGGGSRKPLPCAPSLLAPRVTPHTLLGLHTLCQAVLCGWPLLSSPGASETVAAQSHALPISVLSCLQLTWGCITLPRWS